MTIPKRGYEYNGKTLYMYGPTYREFVCMTNVVPPVIEKLIAVLTNSTYPYPDSFVDPLHLKGDHPCSWCGARWIVLDGDRISLRHEPGCEYMRHDHTDAQLNAFLRELQDG